MKAVILAVGSELLGTERLDTNSLRLTEVLERYGVRLVHKAVLADDEVGIAAEVRRHVGDVDLILLGGGLGPTEDDRTRAAVAIEAGKPLEIMDVNLEGPRAGEVLVESKATGICHTDEFTLSGADPEGLFPAILGHEGAGVVLEVGEGVTSVKPGESSSPQPSSISLGARSLARPTA